jgi:TPR repeat protein
MRSIKTLFLMGFFFSLFQLQAIDLNPFDNDLDVNPIDTQTTIDPVKSDEMKQDEKEEQQEERLEKLQEAAQQGRKVAILELGNNYYYGRLGLEKDTAKAAEWWQMGVDKNHRQCMYNLAGLYIRGDGVEKNEDVARELYMKAADYGLPQANINAALLLDRKALNVTESLPLYQQAFEYYYKAAQFKNARAIRRLAEYYELGLAGQKNILEAIRLYKSSARKGNADAQLKMADYSNAPEYPTEYDPEEALRWLMLAADNGNAQAQAKVGYCFENGIGVRKDNEVALRWYLLSAKKNFAPAQVAMGNSYSTGSGVPYNLKIAFNWYEKAALLGNANGLYNAGVCYYEGIGTEKNIIRAMKYYHQAAEAGMAQAQYALGKMYETGEQVTKNPETALSYFQQAATGNHPDALYEIGVYYLEGRVVRKNMDQAESMLEKAAELGSKEAFALYRKHFMKK